MKNRLQSLVLAALAAGVLFVGVHAVADHHGGDRAAIERAVLDYVEGIYEVKPEYIARSVSADLVKFGYWHNGETGEWMPMPMTFEQLHELAGSWNADGHLPDDAPKKIKIHDIRGRTASASLDAAWGMDHMHLVKEDGRWTILHVLWQSTPESAGH